MENKPHTPARETKESDAVLVWKRHNREQLIRMINIIWRMRIAWDRDR